MFNIPDPITRPDPVHPSGCRLHRLFGSRSMYYESALTHQRDSDLELPFPRSRSDQSLNAYKRLSSPMSNSSKLGSLKVYIPSLHRVSSDPTARIQGTAVRCCLVSTRPNHDKGTRTRIKGLYSTFEE